MTHSYVPKALMSVDFDLSLVNIDMVDFLNLFCYFLCRHRPKQASTLPALSIQFDALSLQLFRRGIGVGNVHFDFVRFGSFRVFNSFIACALASLANLRGNKKLRA